MSFRRPNAPKSKTLRAGLVATAVVMTAPLAGCSNNGSEIEPNVDPTVQTIPNGLSDTIDRDSRTNQMTETDKDFNRVTSTIKDLTSQTTFADQQAEDGFGRRLGEVLPECQDLLDTGSGTTEQMNDLQDAVGRLLDDNPVARDFVTSRMGGVVCGITATNDTLPPPQIIGG